MTKSTITRERTEWLSQISCRDDIEDIGGDEIRELASMALAAMDSAMLAAMDSEPVAYMHDGEDGTEYNGHDEFSGGGKGIPLYRHAQPVPVVSADLLHTAASAIEDLLEHTDPNTSYYSGVWADVPVSCAPPCSRQSR